MEYMVVYSSKTGNTKQVATEIFSALPGMSKDMQNIEEYNGKDADIFFVGFWANRGSCDMSVIDFISELEGKRLHCLGPVALAVTKNIIRPLSKRSVYGYRMTASILELSCARERCRCR